MTAWGRWSLGETLLHLTALFLFTALLGVWAFRKIRRKLTI
jgi:hypothetical protein